MNQTDNTTTQAALEACPWCAQPPIVNNQHADKGCIWAGCSTPGCVGRAIGKIKLERWNFRVSAASAAPTVDQCGVCDEYAHRNYPAYKLCNNCWRVMPWCEDGRAFEHKPYPYTCAADNEIIVMPAVASLAAPRDEVDVLVDEVQHRMDRVVESAVEWHQAGREGAEWFEAAEKLSAAINSLLELRSDPKSHASECFCGIELEAGLCPNGHDPIRPAAAKPSAARAAPVAESDLLQRVREAVELERVVKRDADWNRGYNEAIEDALNAIDRTVSAWKPAPVVTEESK